MSILIASVYMLEASSGRTYITELGIAQVSITLSNVHSWGCDVIMKTFEHAESCCRQRPRANHTLGTS